jgi:PAS domain S-box-containing protein
MRAAKSRATKSLSEAPGSIPALLGRFSTALRDLKPSLGPSELSRQLSISAANIFDCRFAAVVFNRDARYELASCNDPALLTPSEQSQFLDLISHLANLTGESTLAFESSKIESSIKTKLRAHSFVFAELTNSNGSPIGLLCLGINERSNLDRHLLEALASHASMALENARLFSWVETSKKQWIEDFDAITDFIVVHDAANRILRVNRPLADQLKKSPSELIGQAAASLASLTGADPAEPCPLCTHSSSGTREFVHPLTNRACLVSTSQLSAAQSGDARTVHVLKDVTDRHEAERQYRELFDNIQEGLFFCTSEGRFLVVNNALVNMLGYRTADELLRVNLFQTLAVDPDFRDSCEAAAEQSGILRNHEEVLRRKDGSWIYTLQNILAVRDAAGRALQYRGLMLDITEQKSFEVQLKRERDFNKNILNNTQSMILVLDTAGLISYANRRCYEMGFRERDLMGRRLPEFIAPARRNELTETLKAAMRGVTAENVELPFLRANGTTGQYSLSLSPMRDERGEINSLAVVMTDVTDAAVLQAKLMHTEKMAAVGQLVSGVAHEVNNPLAAILGFTDLLLENPDVPGSAREELKIILQEAQRTKTIIQNLLSFARRQPSQREAVQINTVVQQTLQLRSYDFANHGIEVVEQLDENLPAVVGDAHELQQVFLNILNNAYDAVQETGRPGRIEIQTAQTGEHVEIRFRDNGPGIGDQDRIFEPFFTTKEVGKGTGLGLSICYGIVRAHRGEISCANNSDVPGSTFTVRLPATVGRLAVENNQPQAAKAVPAR